MKKTRMPQRLLSLVLVLMMLISVLPVSAMAAELTPSDPETGLTATDVTNELTDSDRLAIFEENMDSDKVSRSEIPADDEMVRVIVQLDADSLLDVRNRTNASMSMLDFQQTDAAKAQLKDIANLQLSVMNTMESKGIPSSFTFSYTSVVSGFAAQVPYGKIHDIKNIDGVEDVVLCQTYYTDSMGSATLGQALTAAEVAAYSNNTQYQGEGMLIGILDTGLDVNHEAFANAPAVQKLQKSSLSKLLYQISQGEDGKTNITAYSYAALWYAQKHSSSSLVLLTEDDLYKSGKVPFAFDYADADADVIPSADAVEKYGNDHGTHVAGITAGKTVDADGNVTFAGQSPEAQLAIFKVFSDSTNGASTDTILAALNDALLLDVDVINMSLGSNGGFGREAEGDLTTKYYDLVKSAGILLNCSAGNSYSSSQGGAKGDFTSVSDPDTGIISSSSSYDAALSVASVNANETAAFVTAQGRVPYQDVSGHDFTALLLGNDSSKTYEYVMVPNTGDTADYQGLDVTGKIAVVMRGGLSFEQKQLNAASAGAAGCIIYNNRDGYLLNMSVDNYKIPTVCISLANGQMMEAAQEKTLTVSKTEKGSVAMSDFSSWGPLPSLSLKPEITAPGGSIYSSLPFAQYGYMSGTSMASPYLAGVAAAALQYVNTLMPGASDTDKQLLVNRLLMSTADILYDENGVAYSPRKQGSGMVNLAEAVTTPAYLYVRGQDKTKIELGDDADQLGVYKLSFVVKNLTGSALSYDVNTTVQTESTTTDGLYIAQKGYVLSADTSAIKVSGGALSGSTVTVPANGEATVTVTVRLSDADRAYLAKFPNGIYVEGFVELTNNDDPALSVPFLGFYGDWTKAPIFEDADIYNGLDEKMYATNVAGVYAMMYVVKLGMYPFVVPEGYDTPSTSADKICVDLGGGNGVSNLYYLQAGLLRAAKTTNVTITDSDTGEVYLNSDGLNVRKAMYNSSSAAVRPGYVGEIFPPLTGIHLIPNNTRMTYTAAAYVDGFDVQDNLKNTYSFNFTSDGEMPYIVDRENLQFRTGDDGRKYLDVTLADNFCLAGATLYSTQWKTNVNNGKKEMSIGSNYYDGIIPALKADGTSPRAYEEYTYTFDVTDFYQKLLQGTFYVVAYDYAMNQCAYRVTLPENAVTKITLDQTAVTLPQKGYVQLNATVTPDDATDQNLVWSSSDSSVAEVKNGIVAAKAPGTATITVKSSVWPDVKAQCQVTVTDEVGADVPMSEFLLNTSSVTMLAGTTYTNVRLYGYAPFYATDLNLEWTSSDESVVTVEPNGTGDELTQYAKLTALKPGTATVTAKAKNGTASYDLAVTVTEATGSGSFNIVGDTLVSYSGTESTVTIPDGVRVIGENAFKNNDYILNVICPDSLEEIGYRAFYDCDNLQSVSLPETMKVINEGAFYYCKNLKTLGHTGDGVLPKGLTSIGVKAFYFCEALEGDLVIPEGVTSLSAGIFYNAYALTSITIPDTVTSMDANGDQFANCTAVTSVTLSKNLTELPKTAFFTLKSLKHLPDLSNVTSVGTSCFAGCAALEEMVIPESLTFIGANAFARSSLTEITVLGDPTGLDSAFYNSLNLTTFVAPKLTTIGKQMFQGCTALVNFIVPDNVTLIGERAFQGCTNLKTLTFPASYKAETLSFGLTPFVSCPAFEGYVIEDGASIVRTEDGTLLAGGGKVLVSLPRDFKGTSYTVPDGVETISDYLFYKNTTITSVTLPASLKKIGTAAFQGCTKLTSIALPDGFTTLGEHAFDGCSGLKTVTFGQSLTAVPAYAFSNCSALTAVDLPATVETVGDYAFRGCAKATALSLKEGLTSIGANAFYGWKALKAITIPQSVTSLGGSAFYDCNAAASIDCGSLTVIPDRAFYNAKAVKTVKLSDNVTSIGERAFYSCSLLETINWPSQLKTIGRQAFYYARKLQNLDFSGTQLESIGNSAFYQPYEARTLAFPGTLRSIDSKAFAYLNYNKTAYVTEVNIPASVTSLAKDAFYLASGLKNIVVDANNPVYASSNGVVMLKDTGDIYIWPQGNETTEFTLPATMTEIPDKMFQNNTSLKKVIVPASVTKVGSYAFSSSKIEEIYFEDSANGLTVGTFAFYNCPNLTSLRLPYGLTSIGANAISKTGLETIVIPDTVTEMGGSALAYNDNLKNVTLSKSMTAVPSRGFVGCESLTELTLPASIQDCGVTDTSVAFNDCTSLQNIYVADGSLYFKSVDGVLFDKNGANLRYYPEGRTAESYRIPEGTIRVGGNAFAGNLFLKSVSYPTTLERIGTKAFFGCENLKDYYFNGMTAPLLETTVSLTGAYANVALYANFVGLWGTTGTGGFVYNDWGLNLYYPQGAVGYTAYVWDKYFNTEKGSVNIMDESYFTPTDLTVTETGVRNALLTWTAAKQSNAEDIVYKVERSVAAHFQDDTQDTWTFEGFETLAEGLTECNYTDTTTLPFGRSYAYRVTAYSLTGETGPAAIGYLYIDADPNNADEMAVLELIKKIEALKPIENLTNEDEAYLRQLLAEYNALTDAQKELVYNYATLLAALEKAGHNPELKNAKPATCTEDGYTGDEVCKVCGEVITKGQVIPATGHKTELVGAKAATCTEDGYTGDEVCTVCQEVVKKGEVIPALGHKTQLVGAKAATCTEDGYTGDEVCTVCNETVKKGEVIPALGHKTQLVGAMAATCTEDGYTGDEVCTVCGETVKKGEVIPALGHKTQLVGAKEATCTEDGYTGTAPYVSLLMSDGQIIKANAEKKEANGVTYYVGKLTVGAKPGVNVQTADYYTMSDFSSWGIPGSLELKPEITAPGGNIYSLQNGGGYQNMSGTSMASPQVAGMAAVVAQYIRANKLTEKTGLTARALAQSLLMSTAVPMYQDYGEGKYGYYSVMQQGAGLANVGAAVSAGTYIKMDKNANAGAADGKVKVELGDDPARTGEYNFGFTIYNLKDAATSFNLSADFFTQNVLTNQFEDGSEVNFEHTYTALLSSNVTWTVDGQMVEMTAPEGLANCDFNGDGKVTKADGQALLDYVTGVLDSISNKDNADFDNDGSIDTYDAYLFFQQLNKSTVEIPANGSIHVEVNAKVLGLDKYDKASDNTGTYVEGYVYADEVASAEGVKGDSHSIPVLGYYGNWTDPSMFDIGSYLEYHEAKTESRVPYMYAYNKNATKYQALTVQYAGDSGMYYFGGNPYVDETYDPNRAAINPDTTVFARATFSLIRNAADARATITGENGTVYYDKASGSPTAGAYYYSNGGSWRNAQGYIGINNAPTKAAEGEKITVKVTEAPEYYVTYDAEGNATTDWDALGDGASQTYTAFIDRTEPVLSNVYFKEDVETGTRSLVLTAQDNRYVAAAFLIDYDEMSILDRTVGSPEGAAEGAATDISLNLSKAEGVDHLLVQVADYADNTATYKINLNKEELSGPVSVTLDKQSIKMYKGGTTALNAEVSPFGVKPDGVTWKSSDETVATVNERGIVTGVNKGTATITAASIKDPTATASCVVTVQTVDTTLVGALMDTNGDAQFYTWDMEHDTTWKKLVAFESLKTVSSTTFDYRNGVVYVEDGEGFDLHVLDLDTGKTLADYNGFEGDIPMWDMEYSMVFSTEANPLLASAYYTYFLPPKSPTNMDLSAFNFQIYLLFVADASYFTSITSVGSVMVDADEDDVEETLAEMFLLTDDVGNIWAIEAFPEVDPDTGEESWSAFLKIMKSNLADIGYAANPTDEGDMYDSLYATVENEELVLYLANCTGDASHVYRILLNEDTGKWEAADIGNFGDGVWPATLLGTIDHNQQATDALVEAMNNGTVYTAESVKLNPAQVQRYNGAETQAANGSLNAAAPVATLVNLPMGEAAETATASNVTVSADEKTVTVNVLAKDAATNGLFTVDYDAANLTLTNVAFNTQYSSYKDASGKVTLGYVDLNGVTAGSTVATLTFTVNDPTALDKINVTVTETERNDQTVNNAETLAADLHTETETVNAKAATCTEDGYTGDVVCKACGKVITKGEVIPALGHKIKLVGAKEPTCTEDGYTGDEVCTICGEIVKKGEVIKATGHQYKDGKCTVCGAADPNYKPAVKTGDESNTALWVLVMASAAMLAAAVVVLPRKKHSR